MGPNTEDEDLLDNLEEEYLDEDFYKDFLDDSYDENDGWIEDFLSKE